MNTENPSQPAPSKRLFLSGHIAAGLGAIAGLLFCAVIIAALGTHTARIAADDMRARYLPFKETAHTLERLIYEAIFHVSMFGVSGDMASYSEARIRFSTIRSTTKLLATQIPDIPEGDVLARNMEALGDLSARLDMVVEKKRTLNDELTAKQAALRKAADDMGEILLDLQARVASADDGRENGIFLDEKARLLVLNGFSMAVVELTGRVFTTGVAKSAEDLDKAQASFTARWKETREACFAAAALPSPEGSGATLRSAEDSASGLDSLVAAYGELLGTIRFNLEETARVAEDRAQITGRFTALTRGLMASVSSSIDAAADRTETALHGSAVTIFACALLACILAAGTAVVFLRSRPG